MAQELQRGDAKRPTCEEDGKEGDLITKTRKGLATTENNAMRSNPQMRRQDDQLSKKGSLGRDDELLQSVVNKSATSITDYNVARAVGKGKFSTVYRAELKSSGETFALKRVSVFTNMSRKSRIKCLEEVGLIQALDHSNIIRCEDAFLDQDELIIVLEWASAGDLKRQIRKANERGKRLEERVIWRYFVQLVSAIEHMHSKRIMHRDLKPANIFLMTDGCVKVGDLGLGRALGDDMTAAYSKVGTPLYMSPEVLQGKGYDWKSDVWSLGCILYELAMLRSPFKEEGIALPDLFKKIETGKYPPLDDHYSTELIDLANSMLRLTPADRPDVQHIAARSHAMYKGIQMRPLTIATQRTSPREEKHQAHVEGRSTIPSSHSSGTSPSPSCKTSSRQQSSSSSEEPTTFNHPQEQANLDRGDLKLATRDRRPNNASEPHSGSSSKSVPANSPLRETSNVDKNAATNISGKGTSFTGYATHAKTAMLVTDKSALLDIDNAADLLTIAKYPNKDLQPAVRFAHDPDLIGGPAGSRHSQYVAFMNICSWILVQMNSSWRFDGLQPPLQNARTLLTTISALGRHIEQEVSLVSPSHLINGFGPPVCRIMFILAEMLVYRVQKICFMPPDYTVIASTSIEDMDNDNDDLLQEEAIESEIEAEAMSDDEDLNVEPASWIQGKLGSISKNSQSISGALGAPIKLPMLDNPCQDALEEWQLELERVSSKLHNANKSCTLVGWQDRVHTLTEAKMSLGSRSSSINTLRIAADKWDEEVSQIRLKEARLNNNFENERNIYDITRQRRDDLESKMHELRDRVDALVAEFDELGDREEEIVSRISESSDKLSGPDRVRKLRTMIAQLGREVKSMNIQIGTQLHNVEQNQAKDETEKSSTTLSAA